MNNSKILVTYFSASRVTESTATNLQTMLNCDIYEIKPKDKYTNADLNWNNKQSRSCLEMNDLSYRPEMIKDDLNIDNYDTILIGFPIWWNLAPTIINTFIESYDLTNKDIYIYATSGGSSINNSYQQLVKQYPSLNFKAGMLTNNQRSLNTLVDTIK